MAVLALGQRDLATVGMGGVTPGTYQWKWGNEKDQTFTIVIPAPVVPLPATLPLFATSLGALGLLSWRKKRKA